MSPQRVAKSPQLKCKNSKTTLQKMKPYSCYPARWHKAGQTVWRKLTRQLTPILGPERWHISRRWVITPRKPSHSSRIHGGHLRIEKCKLRAKSCVYWPDIYSEIENLVTSCSVCQKYHNSQQKEPMIPSEIPSRPWQTVSADMFYAQQSWFLIVVDCYSKFPFVRRLHSFTARAVVNEMKTLFAENGIPKTLQSDNGTQFTSAEFQQLASQYGFEIVTSSPHSPRGHGFVERQVQTVKKTILECKEVKEDIDLALLALRTTPLSTNVASPAKLLNGRAFKSTLPGKIYSSKDQEEFRNWLKARQDD